MSRLSFDSLRDRDDFALVLKSKAKRVGRFFVLFAQPMLEEFLPDYLFRLGIVASRRVGGATERNRIKRLIRETMRLHLPLSLQQKDIVIIVRKDANGRPNRMLGAELNTLLQQF